MSKYIDTDKLITGIEQLKETNKVLSTRQLSEYLQGSIYGFDLAVEKILSIISSFQQEQEVADLEKEIDRVFFQQDCGSNRLYYNEIANIARHFAEWGAIHLNARKEE